MTVDLMIGNYNDAGLNVFAYVCEEKNLPAIIFI
jgi:hypothetical protein